ncbi:MAG: NAD-dependent epimerase/dehydratase family protein [Acidimicrobiales bacterium]
MEERLALVTGATGFIASRLVPALVEAGWEVRACGRRPEAPWLPDAVEYRSLDLVSDPGVAPLVEGVTHVFHLAGASSSKSSQEEMERDNVVATERLFTTLAATKGLQRALHMSSTSVYGEEEQLPSPVPETVEPHPSRGYGKAKWETEKVVRHFGDDGMPVVVLRPVSVHGPGAIKLVASAILDADIERSMGRTTFSVPRTPIEQRLVHIDDLVGATLHLAAHPDAPGRAFNIVSGVYPSSHEIAEILADHFGLQVELDDDPDGGPSYEERRDAWEAMREQGMRDDILLTKERLRFMRKSNRNNRLSIDALLGTGFELQHTDPRPAIVSDARWYQQQGWILGP